MPSSSFHGVQYVREGMSEGVLEDVLVGGKGESESGCVRRCVTGFTKRYVGCVLEDVGQQEITYLSVRSCRKRQSSLLHHLMPLLMPLFQW